MSDAINLLTEPQKQCLRLFFQRYDAKEIARQLDIAPSTVHQRLTAARKKLGVNNSKDAARLLAQAEGAIYDDVLYDGVDLPGPPPHQQTQWASRIPWPFPTRWRPTNDLTFPQTLIAIVGLAAAFMGAGAFYFVAIRILSDTF